MPISLTWLIKRCSEYVPRDQIREIPRSTRGIYALLNQTAPKEFDDVYIGMAAEGGIRGRLDRHAKSVRKQEGWTHFSIYEVHDNVTPQVVCELEGLFRHVYRRDTKANAFNVQKQYGPLKKVRSDLAAWNDALV